jgi:ribonuclease Z
MTKLIILGTANAIPDEEHENTHMALVGEKRLVLIDCVNNSVLRLRQANLDINSVTDLVLTHFHPDHISGVPLLLMNMWLMGRERPLCIYGLAHTLDRMETMLELYEWETWSGFFPVTFHQLPADEMTTVIQSDEFHIFSSPVCHLIPTIGLRVEFPQTGKALAYSCDTEPCPSMLKLAARADVLIHEATRRPTSGHSTARQAGEVAAQANVGSLLLIHYPVYNFDPRSLLPQAQKAYPGEVALAQDFMTLDF